MLCGLHFSQPWDPLSYAAYLSPLQARALEGAELNTEANELTKLVDTAVIPAADRKRLSAEVQVTYPVVVIDHS